jgi:predicted MPP superfamily phosphohydrolase
MNTHKQTKASQNMSRRTFIKRGSLVATGFLAMCGVPFYAYFGERKWVETERVEIFLRRLPSSFDGIRIAHFSDVHYGFYYGPEDLARLVKTIAALNADLIVFTGDLFDGEVIPFAEECTSLIKQLNAPLGKFASMGNHDYYTGSDRVYDVYEAGGFEVLRNRHVTIQMSGQAIQLAGVDDMLLGDPDLNLTLGRIDPATFTVLLAHEPEFADYHHPHSVDLQLSGHTHGGQIRIPLVGEIITPPGGKKYVQGLYPLKEYERYIYTNRGIGTSHIPIRLFCRPEVTLLTLRQHI